MVEMLDCPHCGGVLAAPRTCDEIECTQCGCRFDSKTVGSRHAPRWKQLAGLTLIGLGVLFFFNAVGGSLEIFESRGSDVAMKLLAAILLPAAAVLGGVTLLRRSTALELPHDCEAPITGDPQEADTRKRQVESQMW
jgi:hypothetical protein